LKISARDIENLIYLEGRFLDESKYEDWLNLFTEDALYWMPSWISERESVIDPSKQLSHLYLDKQWMRKYVQRIQTGDAHTYEPTPRVSRMVSNILHVNSEGEEQRAFCKWLMHVYKNGIQQSFAGDAEYRLKLVSDKIYISFKRVILLNDNVLRGQLLLV
jgi:3-phenylpropionate/cinnamic acid dioxygenase small subunit